MAMQCLEFPNKNSILVWIYALAATFFPSGQAPSNYHHTPNRQPHACLNQNYRLDWLIWLTMSQCKNLFHSNSYQPFPEGKPSLVFVIKSVSSPKMIIRFNTFLNFTKFHYAYHKNAMFCRSSGDFSKDSLQYCRLVQTIKIPWW